MEEKPDSDQKLSWESRNTRQFPIPLVLYSMVPSLCTQSGKLSCGVDDGIQFRKVSGCTGPPTARAGSGSESRAEEENPFHPLFPPQTRPVCLGGCSAPELLLQGCCLSPQGQLMLWSSKSMRENMIPSVCPFIKPESQQPNTE